MTEPIAKLSASDPDLMRFAANAADFGSLITDRWDLVVRAGRGLGHGAPACFIPSTAEIELDATELGKHDVSRLDKVGWTLGSIDLVKPTHRNLIPVTCGAMIHECSHSLHTLWPTLLKDRLKEEPAQVVQLALALEEGRHETLMRGMDKRHEPYLISTFGSIILPGLAKLEDSGNPFQLLHALALCTYRDKWNEDASNARRPIQAYTAKALFSDRAIAYTGDEFEVSTPYNASNTDSSMLDIARKWWDYLPPEAKDETKFGESSHSCHSGESESEESEGSGSGALATTMKRFAEDFDSKNEAEAEKAASAATDHEKSVGGSEAAGKKGPGGAHGWGTGDDEGSGVIGSRPATPEELDTARKLARAFQSAQTVTRVKAPKKLPPGRLRGKAAMEWTHDRQRGVRSEVSLFKGKTKTDSLPPIRIGIGLDVSGSMGRACGMSASLGWTLATASWDVNALVSAVCYGSGIMPYAEVGKAFRKVKELAARSGEEAVAKAITYLDEQVDLMAGTGPRILVLISDGHYVNNYECFKGGQLATQFVKAGGVVLYVGRGEGFERHSPRYAEGWPSVSNASVFSCEADLGEVTRTLAKVVKRAYDLT